jgi:hypothetical protein
VEKFAEEERSHGLKREPDALVTDLLDHRSGLVEELLTVHETTKTMIEKSTRL